MASKLTLLILRNLRRQRLRTILTALSFAIAVFIYTVLIAVPSSMDRIASDASKGMRLIVTERNNGRLPVRYCNDIRKMTHVVGCAPEVLFWVVYRDPRRPIVLNGITADIASVTGGSDYHLPPDKIKEIQQDRRKAMVGSVLMREQGWKLNEPITLRSPANSKLVFTLIPIVEVPTEYLSRVFFFDRRILDDAVKNLFGEDIQDAAALLIVRVDSADNMGLVADQIDENFRNSDAETQTMTETDSVANVVTSIGNLRAIVYSLCLVVLLTVLFIAGNSMAMMVRDRTGEVAVMRALGFSGGHVAILLIGEAIAIGLFGGLLGGAAALAFLGHGISLGPLTGMLGYVEVRPATALGAVCVAVLVSVVSAIAPVAGAVRIVPALAFRKVI